VWRNLFCGSDSPDFAGSELSVESRLAAVQWCKKTKKKKKKKVEL
jgi:hypothetical protein